MRECLGCGQWSSETLTVCPACGHPNAPGAQIAEPREPGQFAAQVAAARGVVARRLHDERVAERAAGSHRESERIAHDLRRRSVDEQWLGLIHEAIRAFQEGDVQPAACFRSYQNAAFEPLQYMYMRYRIWPLRVELTDTIEVELAIRPDGSSASGSARAPVPLPLRDQDWFRETRHERWRHGLRPGDLSTVVSKRYSFSAGAPSNVDVINGALSWTVSAEGTQVPPIAVEPTLALAVAAAIPRPAP